MTDTTVRFKTGDVVTPRLGFGADGVAGQPFVVTKRNPKNVLAKPQDNPMGKGLNFPDFARLMGVEVPLPLLEGTIVTLAKAWRDVTTTTPLVVTGNGPKRVNVARVGGGGAMRVPQAGLVERDVAWLTAALVDAA